MTKLELPVKIKNSSNTKMFRSLFYEQVDEANSSHVIFTYKEPEDIVKWGGRTFFSLQKLYRSMIADDPTEYEFAMTVFGDWNYWVELTKRKFFEPVIEEWREERDQMLKSKSVKAMINQVEEGNSSFSVLKYLADNGYSPSTQKDKVGRPSKQKIKEEAERMFNDREIMEDDWERLGLGKDKANESRRVN